MLQSRVVTQRTLESVATDELPRVSIIVPCRNEEQFVGICLDSILANDYPQDRLEVLVVDGMSEDRTLGIAAFYARRYPFIKLLENPGKITPAALNIGIAEARGEVLIRMDAHNLYDRRYILRCVEALEKYGADDVGGIWVILPRENTLFAKAIVQSLAHKFGVGNAHYRLTPSSEPRWVDTVPFFCVKKEIFARVGLFNEELVRGQDMEFSLRLKKAGGRILLVPQIVSRYHARSDLTSFWKHNFRNGVWAILPFAHSKVVPVRWRHLVPLLFVTALLGSAALKFLAAPLDALLLALLGTYALVNLAASLQIAWRERDFRYFLAMPLVFGMLHFGYGLGSCWGLLKLLHAKVFKLIGVGQRYATGTPERTGNRAPRYRPKSA